MLSATASQHSWGVLMRRWPVNGWCQAVAPGISLYRDRRLGSGVGALQLRAHTYAEISGRCGGQSPEAGFLERTWVCFSVPISGSSQPPVIPAPGDLMRYFCLPVYCLQMHLSLASDTHSLKGCYKKQATERLGLQRWQCACSACMMCGILCSGSC